MDVLTKDQRRKNMQAIRGKGTKAEIKLAKTLWQLGYRYRKNNKSVFGKPDLTFKRLKIAIFVDSEFFHGKDWDILKQRLNTNKTFWHSKIERNIQRDIEVNKHLQEKGWIVLRFWSLQIKNNLDLCISIIQEAISLRQSPLPSPTANRSSVY